eukprot:TRINITY_DN35426_c0_g1_i1.p1 TRINITY_DN35426_c0_g1~~TRINITY_DN35426_c0_g1_i1.p1  ORF type:complete len:286 (+),score=76.85 TRINITY_DN35426_c0_g1_i1:64-921(+)
MAPEPEKADEEKKEEEKTEVEDKKAEEDTSTKRGRSRERKGSGDKENKEDQDPLNQVLLLMQDGKFEDSIEALNKMLEEKPQDSILLHNLGVAYTELGKWEEAEKAFTDAWEAQKVSKKVNYATMYGLATVLTEQGEMGKLLQAEALFHDFLEKAVAQEEKGIHETYRAFTGLADNLEKQKRWLEAAEAWRQSFELAKAMFGEESDRAKHHEHKLVRAERLSKWQRNIRIGLWSLTLLVPLGAGYQYFTADGPTALGQLWRLLINPFGPNGADVLGNETSPTAEL